MGQKTLELKSLPEGSRDSVEKSITYGVDSTDGKEKATTSGKVELKEGLNGSMTSGAAKKSIVF